MTISRLVYETKWYDHLSGTPISFSQTNVLQDADEDMLYARLVSGLKYAWGKLWTDVAGKAGSLTKQAYDSRKPKESRAPGLWQK
jgi:hypothetical protein